MDAKVDSRFGSSGFGSLQKPRARHHDRTRRADAQPDQVEERGVGAVAHADVVFMQHDPALRLRGAHVRIPFFRTAYCVAGRPKSVPDVMELNRLANRSEPGGVAQLDWMETRNLYPRQSHFAGF